MAWKLITFSRVGQGVCGFLCHIFPFAILLLDSSVLVIE